MKANQRFQNDEAVSPVIAVILMVAITVVLAATVYIWVTSFSSTQGGGEQATVQATAIDRDSNSKTDSIRLLLSNAPNAPYANATMSVTVNGTSMDGSTSNKMMCGGQPSGTGSGIAQCSSYLVSWANGGSLYVDCQGATGNSLVVTLRQSVVLSQTVTCDK